MHDKIQYYRQPLVTATGILLGFLLNFASNWATKAFKTDETNDILVFISFCICAIMLITVLFRILNMNYPKEKVEAYYKKTLNIFIIGLIVPFLGIILVMAENLMNRYR